MSKEKIVEMTCIVCPIGCSLKVKIGKNGEFISVSGNKCPRGAQYAKQEITDPRRVLPTSVKIINGELPLLSVRTDGPIPKRLIFDVMKIVKKIEVKAPVKRGDVIMKNILNTGVNLIATRTVQKVGEEKDHVKSRRESTGV